MNQDYIDDIYLGLQNSRFVLLLGAGFSASLGYPTASALSEILARNLSPNTKELEGKSLQEVVESLEKTGFSREAIVDYIRRLYSEPRDVGASNPYRLLKRILETSQGRVLIFTTNWDRAIDTVFGGEDAEIISTEEQLAKLLEKKELPKATVIKLHGDIGDENAKESLVLTEEDKEKSLKMREMLYKKFEGTLADSPLLIMGYCVGDSDLLEIYANVRKNVTERVDYLIGYGLTQSEVSNIQSRSPSLNILNGVGVCSFLYALLSHWKNSPPQFNKPLMVDQKIKKAIGTGDILVRGSRCCGKSYTLVRLQAEGSFSGYFVVDLPCYFSAEEDYLMLKDALKQNKKLAIFIPNYYLYYYKERCKKEERRDLFEGRKFIEIDHTINKNEAKELFLSMIQNADLRTRLEDHRITDTVLKSSEHSDRRGYTTYLPSLLRTYATRIEGNSDLTEALEQSKDARQDSIIVKSLEEKIDCELQKEEKAITEQVRRRAALYATLGIHSPWAAEEVSLALDRWSGELYDILTVPGFAEMVSEAVPALRWISLAALGPGLIFSLYNWYRTGGRKKDVLSFLVDARKYWAEIGRAEKEVFAYDFERKNRLPPGSGFPALSALFGPERLENLNAEVENYLEKNPDLFESVIVKSDAWKNLQSQLARQNTSIEELATEYAVHLEEIGKEIEEITSNVHEIQNKIKSLDKEIQKVREDVYSRGAVKIANETELLRQFTSAIPRESLVGAGELPADKEVKKLAQDVINQASHRLVLLTGEPGVGKSTLLYIVGRMLLEQGKVVFFINDPKVFSFTDFPRIGKDSYAIMDVKLGTDSEGIARYLAELQGTHHLCGVIIAIRSGPVKPYLKGLNAMDDICVFQHQLSNDVLLEIARRNLLAINAGNGILTRQQVDSIAQELVARSEGVALYLSEATKKLAYEIKQSGNFEEKMLEELPKGINAMILRILADEADRSPFLLLTYYLVSHYPNFPDELLFSSKLLFGFPPPWFVDRVPDQRFVALHPWYRDVTEWIFRKRNERLEFDLGNVERTRFERNVETVQASPVLAERLKDSYLQSVLAIVERNRALERLREPVSEFVRHLGRSVQLVDLADAVMLCLIFHASGRKLKKAGSEYCFLIDVERVVYESLDYEALPFYYDLLGFIVNNYLNRQMLNEVEKGGRPFYALSVLYLSRLFTGKVIERIDKEFLGESEPTLKLFDIASDVINSSMSTRLYLSAFSSILVGIGYVAPRLDAERADLSYCKGMFEEAIVEYDTAIKLNPNDPDYHNSKGLTLHELKRYEEAIVEYDTAIRLNPNNSTYHNNKGNALCLYDRNRLKEAIAEYDIAIKLDPNNPECHYNKALALVGLNMFKEAIVEFDKAIKLNPNDPDYHNNKGNALYLYDRNRLKEAIAEYDIAMKLDPNDPSYHYNKGIMLHELKRYEEAIVEYDIAIRLNPNDPVYHNNKGITLYELKKYEEAIIEYDIAIKLDPNNPECHYNKGLTLYELKKHEEARESMIKALDISPGHLNALIAYAKITAVMGNPNEGIRKLSESLKSNVVDKEKLCTRVNEELDEGGLDEKEKAVLKDFLNRFC